MVFKTPSLVYLYTSDRPPRNPEAYYQQYIQNKVPSNRFAHTASSDGMIKMFMHLADMGYVDRVNVFVDSKHGLGTMKLSNKVIFHVTPNINFVYEVLPPGDVLFVRGGFKPWLPLLKRVWDRRQNWILFYRANTSNSRWPFWDVHMDDLVSEPRIAKAKGKKHSMFIFPFSKPVNEDVFKPDYSLPKKYDVCVGASHIHKKKGQYKTLQAATEEVLYGKLRLIMPGGRLRCGMNTIIDELSRYMDIREPGGLSREKLAQVMNESKLFVHSGVGGQNDRGVLEAMACGLACVITSPKRFSPFVGEYPNWVPYNQNPIFISQTIQKALDTDNYITPGQREIVDRYKENNGMKEVAIPKMQLLLDYIFNNPKPGSGEWMTSKDFIKGAGSSKGNP